MADIEYQDKSEDNSLSLTNERRKWTADNANEVKTKVNSKLDKSSGATASGGNSVSINARSGVAVFSAVVNAPTTPTELTINNDLITPTSQVLVQAYASIETSYVSVVSVFPELGALKIRVTDGGTNNGSSGCKIIFMIIN